MPYTPYHFGPSGFLALIFKRWLDVPVFIMANVIVDIEVLFAKWPPHRHWHWHTFLTGAVVAIVWALTAYPFRNLFKKIMSFIKIPYQTNLKKMIISAILGLWLHVIIDGFYHFDVQPFWPFYKPNPLWKIARNNHIPKGHIKIICATFIIAAVIIYACIADAYDKKTKPNNPI